MPSSALNKGGGDYRGVRRMKQKGTAIAVPTVKSTVAEDVAKGIPPEPTDDEPKELNAIDPELEELDFAKYVKGETPDVLSGDGDNE